MTERNEDIQQRVQKYLDLDPIHNTNRTEKKQVLRELTEDLSPEERNRFFSTCAIELHRIVGQFSEKRPVDQEEWEI